MSIRRMEYKKNGLDILCRVEGTGEYSEGIILIKPKGEDKYIIIGRITADFVVAPCGVLKNELTWRPVQKQKSLTKKTWHEAATDLYAIFQGEAA